MKNIFEKISKKFFKVPIFLSNECESTNAEVKHMLNNGYKAPFGILTKIQTNGYGQQGNHWEGDCHGNLYASFALKSDKFSMIFSQYLAINICEILQEKFSIDAKTKWPNDIFVNEKKIGGILLELFRKNDTIEYGVFGVGLNILQAPKVNSSRYMVSCLQDVTESILDFDEVVISIINVIINLTNKVKSLQSSSDINFEKKWKLFDFMYGKKICALLDGITITGVHSGITKSGKLKILQDDGEIVEIQQGNASIQAVT